MGRSTEEAGMLNRAGPNFLGEFISLLSAHTVIMIIDHFSCKNRHLPMASLQDQLLKAGIVDQKKAKKISKEKRKQAKQIPKGEVLVNESKEQAQRALARKADQDRQRNKLRQAQEDKKAIHAQVIQLIKTNTIDRRGGETAYQFTDDKTIKKIYVTTQLQNELSRGQLAIVKLADEYTLVPRKIAEKIIQREEHIVIFQNSNEKAEVDVDDPYADYQIPDDLMW